MVNAIDDRCVDAFAARCSNDDLLRTCFDVLAGGIACSEQTRGFKNHVDTKLGPRQIRRVTLRANPNAVAIDDHVIAINLNRSREATVRSIVARQVCVAIGIAEIIDRNDLDLRSLVALVQCAHHVAADSAIAIDGNLNGHPILLKTL